MTETLLTGATAATADTGPEGTPLGEGRMVREDCWREVHRLFHVERRSKSEIARSLARSTSVRCSFDSPTRGARLPRMVMGCYCMLVWRRAWDDMSRRVGGLPAFSLWLV